MGRERKKQVKKAGNFTGAFSLHPPPYTLTHTQLLSVYLLAVETVGAAVFKCLPEYWVSGVSSPQHL